MAATKFSRWQKATALVPLALLSTAWTLGATGLLPSSVATGTPNAVEGLPDGTELPATVVEDPASVTGDSARSFDPTNGSDIVNASSASGIPSAALAAYQRAATVINTADKDCNLDWQLLGAIGRVESNHGRANDNTLTADGVAEPGIFGVPLDGNGVARIADTDGGQYDGDTGFDRALGPMQFIPSTWSIVGVDADGDGKRDPQNVNDAALAAAVYLCSGKDDLSTDEGRRTAVHRYNHSDEYVDTVLAVYEAYFEGDYTSVPNGILSSSDTVIQARPPSTLPNKVNRRDGSSGTSETPNSTSQQTGEASSDPSSEPSPEQPAEEPSKSPIREYSEGVGEQTRKTVEDTGDGLVKTVASTTELLRVCTNQLFTQFGAAPALAIERCVDHLTGDTLAEARNLVTGIVGNLRDLVCRLLPLLCIRG